MRLFCLLALCLTWSAVCAAPQANTQPGLALLSYNVYFDDRSGKQRYPQIIDYLQASGADVIALQEVTPDFFARLKSSPLGRVYHLHPERPTGAYFNVLLTRDKPSYSGIKRLRSRMGRAALYVDIALGEGSLRLINLHLESLDNAGSQRLRRVQLESVGALLVGNSVLLGDFNFTLGSELDTQAPLGLIDSGEAAAAQAQPTYDRERNRLADSTADWGEPSRRLDRIYFSEALTSSDYRVERLPYSDHYPVRVRISPR